MPVIGESCYELMYIGLPRVWLKRDKSVPWILVPSVCRISIAVTVPLYTMEWGYIQGSPLTQHWYPRLYQHPYWYPCYTLHNTVLNLKPSQPVTGETGSTGLPSSQCKFPGVRISRNAPEAFRRSSCGEASALFDLPRSFPPPQQSAHSAMATTVRSSSTPIIFRLLIWPPFAISVVVFLDLWRLVSSF